ncbi:MAG: ATP-binding protein, partial [Clostridia bacterium]|nr:ATP-binding protein [Clostridia bacterium]
RDMSEVLRQARAYAEHFGEEDSENPKNLLLVGGSGIGKTHLSTAIARVVIERGYDVFYNSAVGMLSDFEALRFGTGMVQGDGANVARYTECDLLILDDLGTEVVNQFSLSCLYHVVNTRLNLGLATVISSNLPPMEISKTYSDRIASRLFGEYSVLMFRGKDIRQQKI